MLTSLGLMGLMAVPAHADGPFEVDRAVSGTTNCAEQYEFVADAVADDPVFDRYAVVCINNSSNIRIESPGWAGENHVSVHWQFRDFRRHGICVLKKGTGVGHCDKDFNNNSVRYRVGMCSKPVAECHDPLDHHSWTEWTPYTTRMD